MNFGAATLYVLIVACEVAFWVVLVAALAARYLLKLNRLSWLLLLSVPLIDAVLLALTVLDLRNGATATSAHGLATAYVGFTLAFGSVMVRWADQRFAHRFGSALPPQKPPSHGWPVVQYEMKLWFRCIIAAAITSILLVAVIAFVDQPAKTGTLRLWLRMPPAWVVFWFVFGPLWSMVFFKRAPR